MAMSEKQFMTMAANFSNAVDILFERVTADMTPEQIEAIDTFIDLHIFQIRQLSYGEFKAAYRTTEGQARTRGATVVKWSEVAQS